MGLVIDLPVISLYESSRAIEYAVEAAKDSFSRHRNKSCLSASDSIAAIHRPLLQSETARSLTPNLLAALGSMKDLAKGRSLTDC